MVVSVRTLISVPCGIRYALWDVCAQALIASHRPGTSSSNLGDFMIFLLKTVEMLWTGRQLFITKFITKICESAKPQQSRMARKECEKSRPTSANRREERSGKSVKSCGAGD